MGIGRREVNYTLSTVVKVSYRIGDSYILMDVAGGMFVVAVASSHGNRAVGVTVATAVRPELGRGTRG